MNGRSVQKALIIGGAIATVTCCSTALAFAADSADPARYAIPGGYLEPGPFGVGDITGVYGSNTGQPGEPGEFQGTQTFTVFDSATNDQLGSFTGLVGYNFLASNPHVQIFVESVQPEDGVRTGTAAGQLPAVGSVFNYGGTNPAAPTYTYSSLAGYDVHDPTAVAGTGDVVHSSSKSTFDASAHVDVHSAGTHIALPNGGYLVADPGEQESYTNISNGAPFASTVQGTQVYDVYNSHDVLVGKVDALTISTADLAGGNSQEVMVTGVHNGTIGMADGDVPSVGSVFNYLNYFGFGTSVYTDYAADPGAGIAKDTIAQLSNMLGWKYTTAPSFDAVHGFTDGTNLFSAMPYLDDLKIVPVGSMDYTAINGIPNGGISGTNTVMQGTQSFTVENSAGTALATFSADATTYGNGNVTDETMYLTGFTPADGSMLPAADALPVG